MARKSRILVFGRPLPEMLLYDEPAEDERWVHEQLLNWAVWCKPSRPIGKTRSAEGRYVSPKGNIYNPPEPKKIYSLIDVRSVNTAMLRLPEKERRVLRARYYARLPDHIICRRFDLKHDDYRGYLRKCRFVLQKVLLNGEAQA